MTVRLTPRAIRVAVALRWLLVVTMSALAAASLLLLRAPPAQKVVGFACPMHPVVVDDRPSQCPICGMTLEPRRGAASALGQDAPASAEGVAANVPGLVAVLLTPDEVRRSVISAVALRASSGTDGPVFAVPVHAIIEGASGTYVFVTRDDRLFTPTPVEIQSSQSFDHTYLVTGLSSADRVVVSGGALLDAESRLRATLAGAGGGQPP